MTTRFTRADFDLLPEGFPAQLVRGCLVREESPTYGHGRLSTRLAVRLASLVSPDRVLIAPGVGIDEHNAYQPDVVVIREVPRSMDVRYVGVPLLVVEVLSPSTERRDRRVKCPRLLKAGVAEVWLVDPATKTVEVHDGSGPPRIAREGESLASRAVPGFEVVPDLLFAPPRPAGS